MSVITQTKPIRSNTPPPQYADLIGAQVTGQIIGCGIIPFWYISIVIDDGQKGKGTRILYLRKKMASGHKFRFNNVRFTVDWDGERLIATKLFPR